MRKSKVKPKKGAYSLTEYGSSPTQTLHFPTAKARADSLYRGINPRAYSCPTPLKTQ